MKTDEFDNLICTEKKSSSQNCLIENTTHSKAWTLEKVKKSHGILTNFKCHPRLSYKNLSHFEKEYITNGNKPTFQEMPLISFNLDSKLRKVLFLYYAIILIVLLICCCFLIKSINQNNMEWMMMLIQIYLISNF